MATSSAMATNSRTLVVTLSTLVSLLMLTLVLQADHQIQAQLLVDRTVLPSGNYYDLLLNDQLQLSQDPSASQLPASSSSSSAAAAAAAYQLDTDDLLALTNARAGGDGFLASNSAGAGGVKDDADLFSSILIGRDNAGLLQPADDELRSSPPFSGLNLANDGEHFAQMVDLLDKRFDSGNGQQRRASSNELDVNLHLPANEPQAAGVGRQVGAEPQLSGPINDPADFEAELGHLTAQLNQLEEPNSSNRRALMDQLLAGQYYQLVDGPGGQLRGLNDEPSSGASSNHDLDRVMGAAESGSSSGQLNERILEGLARLFAIDITPAASGQKKPLATNEDNEQEENNSNSNNNTNEPLYLVSSGAKTSSGSIGTTSSPSRYGGSEYIDHPLALAGHQYVQGGAGEGRQLLGPDGSFENVQVIKSDHAVPSYCDPPNPCPLGYSAEDGCLEKFVNSASFSREYQAKQQCSCDNEHSLFNCASGPPASSGAGASTNDDNNNNNNSLKGQRVGESSSYINTDDNDDSGNDSGAGDGNPEANLAAVPSGGEQSAIRTLDQLDTLARTIQNRFGDLSSIQSLIADQRNEKQDSKRASVGLGHRQNSKKAITNLDNNDLANVTAGREEYLVRATRKSPTEKWRPLN